MTHHHAHPDHTHDHSHGHDHDHSHVPTVTRENERKILLSFFLILTFMVIELLGGLFSGSLALLADAGHMLTDAFALILSYIAFRLGHRAVDNKRTFGYLRFEVLAGFLNALTLFFIVGWIIYEAWQRLASPPEILAWPMMLVAIAGLVVNIVVLWIMTRGETEHVNVKGVILHVMGDLLGSIGAIVAAIVIYFTGWAPIDPILSVVVALLILKSSWKLLKKSSHILLEGAPEEVTPDKVSDWLTTNIAGIAEVNHVHIWQLTSGRIMATLHIRATRDALAKSVVHQANHALIEHFNIEHPTIAIDWNDDDEVFACSLDQ